MSIEIDLSSVYIDEKTVKKLNKISIFLVSDLLTFYPYKYEDRLKLYKISDVLKKDESIDIFIKVRFVTSSFLYSNYNPLLKIIVTDGTSNAELLCYGRSYYSKLFKKDTLYNVYGRFYHKRGKIYSSSFDFEEHGINKKFNKIIPLYRAKKIFSNQKLNSIILQTIKKLKKIPYKVDKKYFNLPKEKALFIIHNPTMELFLKARNNLVFEEIFDFMTQIKIQNSKIQKKEQVVVLKDNLYNKILKDLPYQLTQDQLTTLEDIKKDLKKNTMFRIVLGEVGSGKTIVALLSCLFILENSGQVLIMAPTEILAKQHFKVAKYLLKPYNIFIDFLSSSTTKKEQKKIEEDFKNHITNILIGTHSLLYANIHPNKVNLVIIDEQQRFGANQRQKLADISNIPNTLYLSATPIPRTLALSIFAQNEISYIKTMPKDRKVIQTFFLWEENRAKLLQMYDFVKNKLDEKRQCYFVYPAIEENKDILSVKQAYKEIAQVFENYEVSMLHSNMSEKEKSNIIDEFYKGKIDILVSTVIIEVGINVPNASIIVINNADRFGLSTLHQLRGRVGRGEHQSYCFLLAKSLTPTGKERINILLNSLDGFEIAKKDLELRGWGDLINGNKQSGFFQFKLANYSRDRKIFDFAIKEIEKLNIEDFLNK